MDPSEQIIALYETGCDPATIAKALQLPQGEVEAMLFAGSGKFRQAAKAVVNKDLPPAERMLNIIIGLADESDNEFVKLNAAKFARDDLMGRREGVGSVINVIAIEEINKRLDAAEEKRRKLFLKDAITLPD